MEITETTFRLMDVIYIIGVTGGGLAFYWKMIMNDKARKSEIGQLKIDHERNEINLKIDIEKNETTMFKKFTGIHTRMEKNEEKNKGEFDLINANVNELKIGVGAINGKLDILIGQKV